MSFPMKSLSCKTAWLKTFSSPRFLAHPSEDPRGYGARQPGDPVPSDTRPLAEKRSSAAGCRQVSSFPHDTAIMVPSSLPDGMSVTHSGKSISRVWKERGHVCWQGSDIHPEFGTRGLEFILALHAVPHAIRQWSTRTSFVCVVGGGGGLPFCISFIHVCWSSLFCIKSVWACRHRMRNLLRPQICNSVPMCSSVKCEMEAMAGSLPLRDWQ